ncbi:MAG: hypothetical protein FD176_153 [Rhodospirillaceae bacterium]|nr:MAG: hypothetical protein FD176_153 [Rhodospirillaceae bacterium]TNC98671.1 MAG: hypothetical protein FD119_142 [Stygiobacter sp.]
MSKQLVTRQMVEDRIGTCPNCWGQFKVRDDNQDGVWELVLHGYERPGHGHVVGRCPGTDEQPMEHSPDGLQRAVATLRKDLTEADDGSERHQALDVRLRFAEAELANWRRTPIPGIDVDPVPFRPRRPPTHEELAERLRRGLRLRDNLERARLDEIRQANAARPPRLSLTVTVPDPWQGALEAERAAVKALRVKGINGIRPEDIPQYRKYVEASLPLQVAETELAANRDRYRLALGRIVAAWAKTHGFDIRRPDADHRRDAFLATAQWRSTTWAVLEAVGQQMEGIGTRQTQLATVVWTVAADDLDALAEKMGVPAIAPAKVPSAIKPDRLPPFPTWDSLGNWDGVNAPDMYHALQRFLAQPSEVDWLWRVPPHLQPFAHWEEPSRPVACDVNGNAVRFQDYLRDDRSWDLTPFDKLCDYTATAEGLGLTQANLDALDKAGVTAISAEAMAFIPQVATNKYGDRRWYVGHTIEPISKILG